MTRETNMQIDVTKIHHLSIHPAIGIARLGNSEEHDGFYIGPEAPGIMADVHGQYRDAKHAIKRQAARFRIYAYSSDGCVLGELNQSDASVGSVQWTVKLANTKASFNRFVGRFGGETSPRNADVGDRSSLMITPAPKSIHGSKAGPIRFGDGRFLGLQVYLGEIRTDNHGRLVVLGGRGVSRQVASDGTVGDPGTITNYANNDGWHDDTSDGPVTAQVTLK